MTDHFDRLGLPRRFAVDPAAVERAYLACSRELHPDVHALGSDAERRASLELTARLNEAYLAVRDPFRRAEYLLGLLGGPSAYQEKSLDQAFLAEMMDVRERAEEARSDPAARAALDAELSARLDALLADAGGRLDAGTPDLVAVRRLLNAAKTVQSLLSDLRAD
jgi:molecular chaperone HscB